MINGAIHFSGPRFYQDEEDFIASLLREGDWVIDVGCNIGLLSLAAKARVGDSGRCFAFEANPVLAHYARCNSSLNGNCVEVVNAAIGDSSGLVYLSASVADDEAFVVKKSSHRIFMQFPSSVLMM